jgi:hypothetical protein
MILRMISRIFSSRKVIIQNAPPISKREMLKFLSHIPIDDAEYYYKKETTLQVEIRNVNSFV